MMRRMAKLSTYSAVHLVASKEGFSTRSDGGCRADLSAGGKLFRIIASSVVAPSLEKAGEKAGIVGMFPSRKETAQRVFEGRFSRGEEGMLARRGKVFFGSCKN